MYYDLLTYLFYLTKKKQIFQNNCFVIFKLSDRLFINWKQNYLTNTVISFNKSLWHENIILSWNNYIYQRFLTNQAF